MTRLLLKFSLLSLSLLLTSAYAIAICIPTFSEKFSGFEASSIELLVTIPAFSVMIMMLLSDRIASKLGKKLTVQIGLVIVVLSIFISVMSTTYYMMLASRIILGIGLGLINALAVSLISDFFTGNECASMMGFRNAFEGLGQSVLTYIAGFLFATGYTHTFYVYFAAIPIFLLFTLFVPKPSDNYSAVPTVDHMESTSQRKLPWHTIPHCLILLFTVLVSVGFYVKLFDLVAEKNLTASEQFMNNIFTALAFCSMAGGCIFGLIFARLKFFTLPLSLILTALSCILLASSGSMFMVTAACVLNGLAYPLIISYVFNMIGKLSVNCSNVMVTSFMLIGCNVGAMITPYGFVAITSLVPGSGAAMCFTIFGLIFILLAVAALLKRQSFNV